MIALVIVITVIVTLVVTAISYCLPSLLLSFFAPFWSMLVVFITAVSISLLAQALPKPPQVPKP